MIKPLLLATALLALPAQEANFARTYKANEKPAYTFEMSMPALKGTMSVDIQQAVTKALANGKAEMTMKSSRYQTAGETSKSQKPDDWKGTVGANNMPDKLRMQGTNFIYVMFSVAGMTADKAVKVGDEYALSWTSEEEGVGLKGTGKVLAIDPAAKTIQSQIAMKIAIQGQELGTLVFTSLFASEDGSLASSNGVFEAGGMRSTIKIARKKG
jgi:hypothetical protein